MRENEKTILIGIYDGEIQTSTFNWRDTDNQPENQYASITGHSYYTDFFDEAEGKSRAEDYLADGELWRMAVADERTEESMEDFNEMVIQTDGWESVIGDVEEIGDDLYTVLGSVGCIHDIYKKENRENFTDLKLTDEEMDLIWEFTEKLHIKSLSKYTDEDKVLYDKVCEIFRKYQKFEMGMLKEYAEGDLE